jgi:hypothetical protein
MKARADSQLTKAMPALEKVFWNERTGFYSYGATQKREQVGEKTPWSGVGMMFGLFDGARADRSLEAFNGADLCTDWGVRSLSASSDLFEPTNYNYGAVWPFIGSFFNTAQFKNGYSLSAQPVLSGVVRHAFDNAAGEVPEVFSGEMNQKLGEAYHHQGFSTTGYVLPLMRGLVGLEVNALSGVVTLSPRFPANWDTVRVDNVSVGPRTYDFAIVRSEGEYSVSVFAGGTASASSRTAPPPGPEPVRVTFAPGLEPGMRAESATLNGVPVPGFTVATRPTVTELMHPGDVLSIHHGRGVAILPPDPPERRGGLNEGLKIVSLKEDRNDMKLLSLTVEGLEGRTYTLDILRDELVASLRGATLEKGKLRIEFPARPKGGFTRKEVTLKIR